MKQRNYELDYAVASKVPPFNNPRDVRALTEPIVVEEGGSEDEWLVHSSSGRAYDVNTRLGRCSCYDYEENGEHCKHLRACCFLGGLRPISTQALFLDDIAREILNEDNEVDMTADDIEQVAEIRLTAGAGVEPRTKWVDSEGELVDESQPEAETEVESPESGDALDAEWQMVAENAQHAADGGTETEPDRCGAET